MNSNSLKNTKLQEEVKGQKKRINKTIKSLLISSDAASPKEFAGGRSGQKCYHQNSVASRQEDSQDVLDIDNQREENESSLDRSSTDE
ncbi:hypothetical protein CEXT_469891 [Caerostris extrusa]|uniref:Uncharacterized protein n=1 Tax=Caerostris extrusa TaxID=172846 RepID=A0AAV4XWY3_CAEEX|nr:hypothetical protein CEXT_469891 [Caerostris extrusa]